jgi:DNA-binding winged helix-turn-helix (wHTH) protein/TolB-like protein
MSHKTNPIYEFGPFRLDAKERLLLRAGEPVPLTPKAFDLLLALVERQGHLLAKDELMKRVWPETCVEETNLSYNISFIRKALGDGGNGQRYIETAPKHGYRFVGQVREVEIPDLIGVLPSQPEAAISVAVTAVAEASSRPAAAEDHALSASQKWKRSKTLGTRLTAIGLMVAVIASIPGFYYFHGNEPAVKTIAILPFRSLTYGERDEALEMGMTSTLITRLGALRHLIVRPDSAVEKYAQPNQDPLVAGRELKVDAVLDSSYQRSGDKLRFTLRLLRVASGATLWAETFDQSVADPFTIQDAISSKVTGALRLTLSGADKALLAKRYTQNAEAWRLYVRGRHLLHKRRKSDVEKAIAYFQRAIDLDQNFALAYARLGYGYTSLSFRASQAKEWTRKAKVAYDQALKLDDQLAETHAYLALYKRSYEWDFAGAEQHHKRAIELNPNSPDAHNVYAFYLTYLGRFDQAIQEIKTAEDIDPTDQFVCRNVGQALYYARRYDEAIEQSLRAIELDPSSGPAYHWIIRAYEMKGNETGAFTASLKQAEAEGAGSVEIAGMKAAFARDGLRGYWRNHLDRLLEGDKTAFEAEIRIAILYAHLGQKEEALACLERAVENRNHYVTALNVEPLWDSYRSDPRFQALVQRVGLPQSSELYTGK